MLTPELLTNSTDALKESPLACDMGAIEPDRREQHIVTAQRVFRFVTEIRELADGYAFWMSGGPDTLLKVAVVRLAREALLSVSGLCDRGRGGRRARAVAGDGREGVKAFIREKVSGLLGAATN